MKKNKNILVVTLIVILTTLISTISFKIFYKTEKIVFVDLQKVYKDFKMKSEIETEAKGLLQIRQIMLDSLLNDLQLREAEVLKSKDKEIKKNFEKDKESYFQKKQYFENSGQQIIEQYNTKLWETIQNLSVDYAKENGLDLIIGKGSAQVFVYGKDYLDYTNSFVEYINKHYSEKKK